MTRKDIIKFRRGTAAEWTSSLPQPGGEVLRLGEPGYEKDTGKLKIGDGVTPWNSLGYINNGTAIDPEVIQDILGDNFIVGGSGINVEYDDNGDMLFVSVRGLDSSYISDFNSSVSGLISVKDIVNGSGTTVSSSSGIYSINIISSGLSGEFDKISFNINLGDPDLEEGELAWNNSEGSLALGTSDTHAIFVGEEMLYRVRNNSGSIIRAGTAVYASGLTPGGNNRIEVAPYAADGNVREIRFMGLMMEDCDTGLNGYATHFGYIRRIDTRGDASTNGTANKLWTTGEPSWSEGDILYVHPTVPGKLTKIEPKHSISVAIVLNRHQNEGKIFVRPTSYGHLDDNHDVNVGGVVDGQYLQYSAATDYWIPTSSGNFTSLQVDKIKIDDCTISVPIETTPLGHFLGINVDRLVIDTTEYAAPRGSGLVTIFGTNNPTLLLTNEEPADYSPEIKLRSIGSAGEANFIFGSYYQDNLNAIQGGVSVNVIDSEYRLDITSSGELRLNANPIRFGDGNQGGYSYFSDGTIGNEMGLIGDLDDTIAVKDMGDSSYRYGGPNGSEFLVISSSGNVGIGNTNPSYKLDVDGSGNFASGLFVDDTPVSVSGHTHTTSDITDFNISVSGLLPTIANSGDNRILTSTGTSTGINAESTLTFDGNRLVINIPFSGVSTAGASYLNDGAGTLQRQTSYANPSIVIEDDGTTVSRATNRQIFFSARGSVSSPLPLDINDAIFVLRADGYNPHGTLNANGNLDNRTARIYSSISSSGTHYLGSSLFLETSTGGATALDNQFVIHSDKRVTTNCSLSVDEGLSSPTPIYSLGTVSGNTAINYAIDKQIQTLTLNGTSVNFTKGTGWDIANKSVDVFLEISVSSLTTVAFDSGFVTDWYNPLPTFNTGKYLVLLRSMGSSVVQGHYIGTKTN